jgi:predicted dinucleotide-binding enzyme
MNIAILGTGNVGGALATKWSEKGHHIYLGVKNKNSFKGIHLLNNVNTTINSIPEAVKMSEVVLLAIPPSAIFDILEQVQDWSDKILIDATNSYRQFPEPYKTVYHCLADKTKGKIVKCFNSTGFENIVNPIYNGQPIDMFMAGDSSEAKMIAKQLSLDAGFGSCYDIGLSENVELLEKIAFAWINLARVQGRNIAFKVIKR